MSNPEGSAQPDRWEVLHVPGRAEGRAFGAQNRAYLLEEYLKEHPVESPDTAWLRIYELLMWIDRTTGLAHGDEADKCRPGRPWYARSLAFHDWLSKEFDVGAARLGERLDWLFRAATQDVAQSTWAERAAAAQQQREPYAGRSMPSPGEDPELVAIVRTALNDYLMAEPSDDDWRALTEHVVTHLSQENNRKNLLGEGFEDALAAIIRALPAAEAYEVRNRVLLGEIPGFNPQGGVEKQKRVDLAMWGHAAGRVLVTSKWSIRADREEQFGTDFAAYVRSNAATPFRYVLVTNEFDAARLKAACQRVENNAYLFDDVVHVNPQGVLAAYGGERRGAAADLPRMVDSGRLVSLASWLTSVLSS